MNLLIIRLIIFVLVCWAGWNIWRYWQGLKPPAASEPLQHEKMVRCAHCHLHLPESEALHHDGYFFCSTEHQQAFQPPKD